MNKLLLYTKQGIITILGESNT